MKSQEAIQKAYLQAQEILKKNSYVLKVNGKEYRRTLPSPDYYTHQWLWDSCTHAMGLVFTDTQAAYDELEALVAGQWENGHIGHITFDPGSKTYFPGPEVWATEQFAVNGITSSGITQPALLAIALEHIFKVTNNRGFAEKIVPHVVRFHKFLKKYRDPDDQGLIAIIHPWEAGTDNSPCWDETLQKINISDIPEEVIELVHTSRTDLVKGESSDRPKNEDYYRYLYLVDLYKKWGWNFDTIVKESPFVLKDALFNAIWCRANEALGTILVALDREDEAKEFFTYAEQTRKALQELWDQENQVYVTIDATRKGQRRIPEDTIAIFLPLLAGAVDDDVLGKLIKKLTNAQKYWTEYPVPTTPFDSSKFTTMNYWRGPTWPITNLFIIEGLQRYSHNLECKKLRDELVGKTIMMIAEHGFYEHYDPLTGLSPTHKESGGGMGFASFSWSAAIYIYLVNKYKKV